jgi:hypothetical protein
MVILELGSVPCAGASVDASLLMSTRNIEQVLTLAV